MKTQIITLESHDDLISVRDRLSWAKTPRILLIWPKGERIELRSLDLKVLQRHADSLGAQLGIVTRIDSVRRKAEALELPVFESSAAAQRDVWPHSKARRNRQVRPPRSDLRAIRAEAVRVEAPWRISLPARVMAFATGILAVLALVGVLVPRAQITVHPEARTQKVVIPVSASPRIKSVFVTGGVPAREEKVVLSGSKTVNSRSMIASPQTAALGEVRFRNLTQGQVDIPAGTVVYSSGESAIRFQTLRQASLPAGLDETVDVPVEAVEPGLRGNVGAGSILGIEGPLGLSAAVGNSEPTGGGSNTTALGASEKDRQNLRESLLDELRAGAEASLRERLPEGDILLIDTLAVSQTLEETFDPPIGEPGTKLSLNTRLDFSAKVVSAADLRQLAETVLNAATPEGFSGDAGALTIEQVSIPKTDLDGTTNWQMQASRRILHRVDGALIMVAVRGRSVREAKSALERVFEWRKPPDIAVTPPWWPLLPLIPFRITVTSE